MLISGRVFENGRCMQPRFMGKGTCPHIGRRAQRHPVQDIIQAPRQPHKARKRLTAHPGLQLAGERLLQQQRRDQCHQIGIATTLAQPVQSALNLPRPRLDRSQRIGHRIAGIVVAMDAQTVAGDAACNDLGHHTPHFAGQGAAIGVTKHDPARPGLIGGAQARQRIGRIGAVAVEEMLRIKQRLAPAGHHMFERSRNRLAVFVQRDAKRCGHMKLMAFAHQTNRRRARIQHRRQHIIILGRAPHPLGHAKGGHGGAQLWHLDEKLRVGRIRPRPAALDVIDAQSLQRRSNLQLFSGRELHALRLLAVAQSGVEEIEAVVHCSSFRTCAATYIWKAFTRSKPSTLSPKL